MMLNQLKWFKMKIIFITQYYTTMQYLYFNEVNFLVIIRKIGQKCPKKLNNALKLSKNALKMMKFAKNAK